jgi:hypothetical protein
MIRPALQGGVMLILALALTVALVFADVQAVLRARPSRNW